MFFLTKLVAGGITGFPPLEEDIIFVTMWDGSTYRGIIARRDSKYVPRFLMPNTQFPYDAYYIRTNQLHIYAFDLHQLTPPHTRNPDLHTPRHSWMKIGNNELYSGENFEEYPVNEHHHRSTIGYVEGNFPDRNHVYIAVPNKGVYRSVLH